MPVYDYKCSEHGIFYELNTFEQSAEPCACPVCGALSPRIICIAPEVLTMAPNKKKAHAINEKSRHEPAHSTREQRLHEHQHTDSCGCSHNKAHSKLMYTAEGNKMFPSARPWMISH